MQRAAQWFLASLMLTTLGLSLQGCAPAGEFGMTETKSEGEMAQEKSEIMFPCLNKPEVTSTVPGDTKLLSQVGIDCFAWQEFIGLNWPADPAKAGQPDPKASAADFGKPSDTGSVVWETYMDAHQIFRADAISPAPWGTPPPVPDSCQKLVGEETGQMRLMQPSKVRTEFEAEESIAQAFPFANPAWLADRDGNLVWYELLVSEDEFNYIAQNAYYNAEEQYAAVSAGKHVVLPAGVLEGALGAIELKAAWLTVQDPSEARWRRFKLTEAYIVNSTTEQCEKKTLALVGLHILHKTVQQPQWTWATFEHVDNAPDTGQAESGQQYTFYNPTCQEMEVPSGCQAKLTADGKPVRKTSCDANVSPAYYIDPAKGCNPYPVRVTRDYAIPNSNDNPVVDLNKAVHELIRQANPDSVWQYYELVNVLWSDSPVNDNAPGTKPPVVPLSLSGQTPPQSSRPVANTTMETYAQAFNCLHCHRNGTIADSSQDPSPKYASDYSFLFSMAQPPASD